jgi:hypothetical protein
VTTAASPKRAALTRQLAGDLRGVAQLLTDATIGVADISEGVHRSVWRTLGAAGGAEPGRTRGLTGAVYGGIRGAARLVGAGADRVLAGVQPLLDDSDSDDGPRRQALLAALNGVLGGRLAASGNALAMPMSLRIGGRPWDATGAPLRPKVLLMVHGLCMNDLQWQPPAGGHAEALSALLGAETLALRYNSGRHISDNGGELSSRRERLVAQWPGGLESISVLAHSMGGLVLRSALHQATQQGMRWPQRLRHIVFLGTPHHGAPLERAGHWLDLLLGSNGYSAPFLRLTQLRSAGIGDLRHGRLLAADRQRAERNKPGGDARTPLPLPTDVACFCIAASTSAQPGRLADGLVGDGLVPLASALGRHADAAHTLAFAAEAQRVFQGMNHMQLLHHRDVTQQLQQWLAQR